jgi:hypothetical protein
MYDIVEGVFYPDANGGNFTAGPQADGYWSFEYSIPGNLFSSTQFAAINSGINTTKVAQIETNKNNISLLQEQIRNYSVTVLWDYTTDNNGTIQYDPFIGTLHDNINNYDAIQFEVVSDSGDLGTGDWDSTMLSPIIPVYALNNSFKNNYFNYTSFDERSSRWYIKDTTVQKTSTNIGQTNGLVRVYGIKF